MHDGCGFFRWMDSPTPDHLKTKLIEMSMDIDMYKWRWRKALKDRDDALRQLHDALRQLHDAECHIEETGTELAKRRKEVEVLSDRVNLSEELAERIRGLGLGLTIML